MLARHLAIDLDPRPHMNHFRHIRHRVVALVGLTASIVVLAPAAAQAADLIVTPDGVLHYKADPGRINNVSFDEDLGVLDANPVPAANATRCDSEAAAAV